MVTKVTVINRQRKIKVTKQMLSLIKSACEETLKAEKINKCSEIDVTLVSDLKIKQINRDFRDINKSTDVLSFPMGENGEYDINPETGAIMLGDVVISLEHALSQADLFGHGVEREVAYLTVHSVLHLLGYDHVNNEKERKIMRKREELILGNMGLAVESEK